MASRGRRPRPTALKLLHGERRDRVNVDEPVVPALPPNPGAPATVGSVEVAAAYDEILGDAPAGVLTAADRIGLRLFAQVLASHDRAADLENTVGTLVRDEHGQPRKNPAVQVRRDAGRDALRWCIEFGMTPASRSQIHARLAGGVPPASDPRATRYLSGG